MASVIAVQGREDSAIRYNQHDVAPAQLGPSRDRATGMIPGLLETFKLDGCSVAYSYTSTFLQRFALVADPVL